MTQTLPQGVEYVRILPEIVLSLFGMVDHGARSAGGRTRAARNCWASSRWPARWRRLRPRFTSRSIPGLGFWGMVKVDSFSIFFHFLVTAITAVVILSFLRIHGSAADPGGRILRADSVWRGRHVPDVVGGRAGADLHRAGNFFDFHLRAGRIPAAGGDQQRSFAEIFPAGFVCHRFLSVRSGADVRSHRIDQHCGHRPGAAIRPDSGAGLRRHRADVRGTGFQSGGRSLSCLDP